MNPLAITALVCICIVALIAAALGLAWVYDRFAHREPLVSPELRRGIWINTWQIALCCLFGLAIAWIYFRGWCETWQP